MQRWDRSPTCSSSESHAPKSDRSDGYAVTIRRGFGSAAQHGVALRLGRKIYVSCSHTNGVLYPNRLTNGIMDVGEDDTLRLTQLSGGCDMPHSRVHKDAYAAHTICLVPFLLKKLLTYNGHIDIDEFFVRNDEWVTSKANQQRLKDLPYNLRVQTRTVLSISA